MESNKEQVEEKSLLDITSTFNVEKEGEKTHIDIWSELKYGPIYCKISISNIDERIEALKTLRASLNITNSVLCNCSPFYYMKSLNSDEKYVRVDLITERDDCGYGKVECLKINLYNKKDCDAFAEYIDGLLNKIDEIMSEPNKTNEEFTIDELAKIAEEWPMKDKMELLKKIMDTFDD